MKCSSAVVLALLAGVAPLAVGQVTRPQFYVWSAGGRPYTGTGWPIGRVAALFEFGCHYADAVRSGRVVRWAMVRGGSFGSSATPCRVGITRSLP
jgi:hypothetical protein